MPKIKAEFSWKVLIAIISFSSQAALSFPRPEAMLQGFEFTSAMVAGDSGEDYDFNGIAKLSDCSGSLVRFETSKKTDKGMILTNGHCVPQGTHEFIKPNAYLSNVKASRSFRFLRSNGQVGALSVNSTQILYATLTGTDLALYELALSYQDIESKYDVDALTISSERPVSNEPIEVLSGFWQRGYTCHIDQFIFKVQEDKYTWNDSIRFSTDGCHTIAGTSGSPVLSKATRKVIAISNTGNDEGQRCTQNNPCEVSQAGEVSFKRGLTYAQQTYVIYSCLNNNLKIDLSKPGCKLFH